MIIQCPFIMILKINHFWPIHLQTTHIIWEIIWKSLHKIISSISITNHLTVFPIYSWTTKIRNWQGLYTAPHNLLESTRLVTQTFSVSHRPNWQVQSSVVRQNMPCSGRLSGFRPDFSANQVHWTPADSSRLTRLQWISLDSSRTYIHPYLIINKKVT